MNDQRFQNICNKCHNGFLCQESVIGKMKMRKMLNMSSKFEKTRRIEIMKKSLVLA